MMIDSPERANFFVIISSRLIFNKRTMTKKQQQDDGKTGINSNEFDNAISQICEEKGIDKDKVMETVAAALAAAYKKDYGKKSQNIRAEIDKVSGKVDFYLVKEVVDDTVRELVELDEEGKPIKKDDDIEEKNEKEKKEVSKNEVEEEEERLPRFNPERDIELAEAKKIKKDAKVGDIMETKLDSQDDYGRVAAQTAKQVIIQRIREAEKEAMYNEYKEKEGEVLSGTIQRIEGQNVFIDLGKAVGVLFPSEQIKGENYHIGQRIKVYLDKIDEDQKGSGVILSRIHPEMVRKIFELEVPEIFTGTVEIKAIAREAGSRTKIAVIANEEGLDPIGSCVGQKGTRVQAVIDELGGEKIDIIEWSDDPKKFIAEALSPAKILRVEITDEKEKNASAFVEQDQLSLAIGQRGQNVRLAAKLTDWNIDIVSVEDEKKNEEAKEKSVEEEGSEKVNENDDNQKEKKSEKEKEGSDSV
ncbi:MAG TPA: transcription termination/antitermination protein NusA, partial [Candidatus Moranbacteria bacterium]|nr:transcription termination/antitermination protein NusA [Candidatus Moranbacteria bacterium]